MLLLCSVLSVRKLLHQVVPRTIDFGQVIYTRKHFKQAINQDVPLAACLKL